jgi:aryl-alcohol dehydrogenase-like predicted oxidoreductase
MRRRRLGKTGLEIPELCLGTWGLSGDAYGAVEETEQDQVIERALALGVTAFETADAYAKGAMESRLGRLLEKHDEAVVITKVGRVSILEHRLQTTCYFSHPKNLSWQNSAQKVKMVSSRSVCNR